MNIKRALEKLSVLLLVTFVMFSCEPEKDLFTPFASEPIDVNEILDELVEEGEAFLFDNDSEQQIVTLNGTIIAIPKNIFRTKSGVAVSGEVNIIVKELFDKGDILLNRVPTVSDGRLIKSDGVFHISATQEGEELELITDKKIKIQLPKSTPDERMELFYGDESSLETFDWEEADGDDARWDNVQFGEWGTIDSLTFSTGFGYECFPEKLNWINIDAIVDVPDDQKTSVCVELPEIYTSTNTMVAMVFKDINSVVLYVGRPDEMQFCEPYGLSPIGYEVTLVALSTQGEDLYHFATLEATITDNLIVDLLPEEKTKEEIMMILDGL